MRWFILAVILSIVSLGPACLRERQLPEPVRAILTTETEDAAAKKRSLDKALFFNKLNDAHEIALYEGLPHQFFERALLDEELKTKKTVSFCDYPFYAEPLEFESKRQGGLKKLFRSVSDFEPIPKDQVKWCGGFHPDYALEWRYGTHVYHALICFGCREILISGPGIEFRSDLNQVGGKELADLLLPYQKNRPSKQEAREE